MIHLYSQNKYLKSFVILNALLNVINRKIYTIMKKLYFIIKPSFNNSEKIVTKKKQSPPKKKLVQKWWNYSRDQNSSACDHWSVSKHVITRVWAWWRTRRDPCCSWSCSSAWIQSSPARCSCSSPARPCGGTRRKIRATPKSKRCRREGTETGRPPPSGWNFNFKKLVFCWAVGVTLAWKVELLCMNYVISNKPDQSLPSQVNITFILITHKNY